MDLAHHPSKLCILSKWTPHFEGYGFDLMTKKSGEGHYISMVHEGGPAEATHLEPGDWLIEVNSVNVEKLTHSEVIKLIKDSPDGQVKLLLVPSKTEEWRKRHRMTLTSSHPDLIHYITPPYQGKIRSFINGAIDMIVNVKRGEADCEETSAYHRYSLPMPSGMEPTTSSVPSNGGVWPHERSLTIGGGSEMLGRSPGGLSTSSMDEQRAREIAAWRDKSFEMLMAGHTDQNDEANNNSNHHHHAHQLLHHHQLDDSDVEENDEKVNQEKIQVDIHQSESSSITNDKQLDAVGNINRHITTITILDGEYFARLCRVSKINGSTDYGFKMNSRPSGGGHFLHQIAPDGSAALCGIKENDRLIEVNNANVEYTDHATVVNMIRKSPNNEVTLLVVDNEAYNWFKQRNIRIHHGAGSSLIRYCDHRGMRGNSLERDASLNLNGDGTSLSKPERQISITSSVSQSSSDSTTQGKQQSYDVTETKRDLSASSGLVESRSSLGDWSYIGEYDRGRKSKTIVEVPDDAPRPRLCSITKEPDEIFGFTLNTYEKGKVKLISEVDRGSPAEAAGLLQWDRVIEVNGVNINIENHAQVKGRIEASGNRLHLLVLPENQYIWYERADIVPRSNQSNVIYLSNRDVTTDSFSISQSLREESMISSNSGIATSKTTTVTKPTSLSSSMVISSDVVSSTSSVSITKNDDDSLNQPNIVNEKTTIKEMVTITTRNKSLEEIITKPESDDYNQVNPQVIHNNPQQKQTEYQQQLNTLEEEPGSSKSVLNSIESSSEKRSKKKSLSKRLLNYRNSLWSKSLPRPDKSFSGKSIGSTSNLSVKSEKMNGRSYESDEMLISGHNQQRRSSDGGDVIPGEGDQFLDKLKTLSARDVRLTRQESKIQAYLKMSQLDFSERIKYFEDL